MSTNFQRGASHAKRPAIVGKKQDGGASLKGKKSDKHVCERIRGPYLARHFGGMVLWATILFLQGAGFVGKFLFSFFFFFFFLLDTTLYFILYISLVINVT